MSNQRPYLIIKLLIILYNIEATPAKFWKKILYIIYIYFWPVGHTSMK